MNKLMSSDKRRERNIKTFTPLCNIVRQVGLFLNWKCFLEKDEFIRKYIEKENRLNSQESTEIMLNNSIESLVLAEYKIKKYEEFILYIKKLSKSDSKLLKTTIKEFDLES